MVSNISTINVNKQQTCQHKLIKNSILCSNSKDIISFGMDPETLIIIKIAKTVGKSAINKIERMKLVKALDNVLVNPESFSTNTLVDSLNALTKVDDKGDLLISFFNSEFYLSKICDSISTARILMARQDFLQHIPDNNARYRQAKIDFFQDIFESAYSLDGRPNLSTLNDLYYKDLKKGIINRCLYSTTYPEKYAKVNRIKKEEAQKEIGFFVWDTIPKLSKSIYRDFLKENKSALKDVGKPYSGYYAERYNEFLSEI